MRVVLLGRVAVRGVGGEVVPARQHRRCLLAILALSPGHPVPAEILIDRLWGDEPPRHARESLYTHASAVRRLLDRVDGDPSLNGNPRSAALRRRGGGYVLDIDPARIDLHHARHLAGQARAATARQVTPADRQRVLALWRQAHDLWQGTPLAGLTGGWAQRVREGLEQEGLALAIARYTQELEAGEHAAVLGALASLVAEHPLTEPLIGLHMLALYRCGRVAEALRAYATARRSLVEAIGDGPGPELQQLHTRILRRDPELDPVPAGPVRVSAAGAGWGPPTAAPAQLPPPVSTFTGRTTALRALDSLLCAGAKAAPAPVAPAVVDGSAGVGKTALVLQWAHRNRQRFPDGQLYVDLRGFSEEPPLSPGDVLARFLRALGVPPDRVPADVDEAAATYRSLMADRRVLVVLDNAVSAEQVRPLLPGGAGCAVLVTSRYQLAGLVARDGAQRLALDALPAEESRALLSRSLGGERVGAEPDAAAELADLCCHLPLALRIAAANLLARPNLPIAEYVALLRKDRLSALALPEDTRSAVSAAFALSYGRLPEVARRVFRRLALAPGPDVTTETAAVLAGADLGDAARHLEQLARAHLLEECATGRYRCHDLLRRYAADRLAQEEPPSDRDTARRRLYEFYLRRTDAAARIAYPQVVRLPDAASPGATVDGDAADPAVDDPGPGDPGFADAGQARAWLDAEQENLEAAVRRAEPVLYPVAWRIADNLRGYFWLRVNTQRWSSVARAALAAAEAAGDRTAQAAARLSLGLLAQRAGRHDDAAAHLTRAAAQLAGGEWVAGEAAVHAALGTVCLRAARLGGAIHHLGQARVRLERLGLRATVAAVLGNLAIAHCLAGRLREAAEGAQVAEALCRDTGHRSGEAVNLGTLGEIYRLWGRLAAAADLLTRSCDLYRSVGNGNGESVSLGCLAAVHLDAGRDCDALEVASRALDLARRSGGGVGESSSLNILAGVHLRRGRLGEALWYCQRARDAVHRVPNVHEEAETLITTARVYERMGQLDRAHDQVTQALTLSVTAGLRLVEGRALTTLAGVHLSDGEADRTVDIGEQALGVHRETGYRLGEARTHVLLGHAHRRHRDVGRSREHRRRAREHWRRGRDLLATINAAEARQVADLLAG